MKVIKIDRCAEYGTTSGCLCYDSRQWIDGAYIDKPGCFKTEKSISDMGKMIDGFPEQCPLEDNKDTSDFGNTILSIINGATEYNWHDVLNEIKHLIYNRD